MALIDCTGCGRSVSEHAAACPACGHPGGAAHLTPVVTKNSHPILTFLGGVVMVIFVLGAIGKFLDSREQNRDAAKPGPAARFTVADVLLGEDCMQLGDYCVTVHCTVHNDGDAAGARQVVATLRTESGNNIGVHRSSLTLLPGATQRIDFNFSEASLDDGGSYRARCDVESASAGGAA
jgi:hypothetical protein